MNTQTLKSIIAKNLRTLMNMRGVTVRDLEKETNLSKATIKRTLSYEPTHDIKIASLIEDLHLLDRLKSKL